MFHPVLVAISTSVILKDFVTQLLKMCFIISTESPLREENNQVLISSVLPKHHLKQLE